MSVLFLSFAPPSEMSSFLTLFILLPKVTKNICTYINFSNKIRSSHLCVGRAIKILPFDPAGFSDSEYTNFATIVAPSVTLKLKNFTSKVTILSKSDPALAKK